MKIENRKVISLAIRPDILRILDKKANAAGLSRSRYIELIVNGKEVKKNEQRNDEENH